MEARGTDLGIVVAFRVSVMVLLVASLGTGVTAQEARRGSDPAQLQMVPAQVNRVQQPQVLQVSPAVITTQTGARPTVPTTTPATPSRVTGASGTSRPQQVWQGSVINRRQTGLVTRPVYGELRPCQPAAASATAPVYPAQADMTGLTSGRPMELLASGPDLVPSVDLVKGVHYGDGTHVVAKVQNKGSVAVMTPFSVGFRAPGAGSLWVGWLNVNAAADPIKPGETRVVEIAAPVPPIPNGTKLVVGVDTTNTVPEGTAGEANNTTAAFTYQAMAMIAPAVLPAVQIKSFMAANSRYCDGESPLIFATIVGQDAWHASYVDDTGKTVGPAVASNGAQFPVTGVLLPAPWPNVSADRLRIRLEASSKGTVGDTKEVEIRRAKPLNGTLAIKSLSYAWENGNNKTGDIVYIDVDMVAYTSSEFEFGNFGKPVYGSLIANCAMTTLDWKLNGAVYAVEQKPVLTAPNDPCMTYSITGAWKAPIVVVYQGVMKSEGVVLKPVNGVCEFRLQMYTNCKAKVQGLAGNYGNTFPKLSVELMYHTTAGWKTAKKEIEIKDAPLKTVNNTIQGGL